ncbi:MAG TPA: ABC transporter permease, partial [Candidatus Acidoferrum sp.]|nr:ABC transporter permease [Candidatus Acidoferrum sp.]
MRNLFLARRVEAELDEEVRGHLEMLVEENVRAGMTMEKARRAARMELGGRDQVKEQVHERQIGSRLYSVLADCRYAVRQLRKKPGFTAVAVLTLALGIAASATIYSIVDAVLLKPLPYKGGERLAAIWCTEIGQPGTKIFASYRDFEEFQANSQTFEAIAALTWARAGEILTWKGEPHQVLAIPASANFFSVLGAAAEKGRTFSPEDAQNGCTVVLAHAFWQKELGAPVDIVGAALMLNGKPCTVAGLMPGGFEFYPRQTSLWTLITADSPLAREPFNSAVGIFGRLKPGVTLAVAEQELTGLHQRVAKESRAGSWVAEISPMVRELRGEFTWMAGRNLRQALMVLSGAVLLLLLIACVNVASLLLGRSMERQRELAVRAALGSGRARLLRQLLTESMVLAVTGASFGILLAWACVRYFNAANPVELPPGNPVAIKLGILGFAIFATTVTGLVCGALPAWQASRVDANEALKESGRSVVAARHRTGQFLVVGQLTASVVLLAGASLMIQSILRLGQEDLGFRADHILTARVSLPSGSYASLSERTAFYEKLTVRLNELPGVQRAAMCSFLPGYEGASGSELSIAGKAPIQNLEAVNRVEVSENYFRTLGIPLLHGREFDGRDREGNQPAAIVNEEMVRRYFSGGNAIGAQIKLGKAGDQAPWFTIIGVVGNEKRTTVYQEMGYAEPAQVYLPVKQASSATMGIVLRTAGNALSLGPALQRETSALNRNVPVHDIRTLSERNAEFLAQPRFRAVLMGIFAAATLLLAGIGLYGLLAQIVSQRTHEIGLRLALGEDRSQVLRMVVGCGLRLTVVGLGVGTGAAMGLTRLLESLL